MKYDSKGDTLDHIRMVQIFINKVVIELMIRAQKHDESKLQEPEKKYFDEWTPRLSGTTYGSDEYRNMLNQMRPAIEHHQKNNSHHPEFFESGIAGMNLIDLIEMIADWKAATLRHSDGDINRSLEINRERFGMSKELYTILSNTVEYMGWKTGNSHISHIFEKQNEDN